MRKILIWLLWSVFFLCTSAYADTYTATRANVLPTIDGDITEFSLAVPVELSNSNGTVGTYRFMWDDIALYIVAMVEDADLNAIGVNRDDPLYRDDSIELFFDTLNNDGATRLLDDYKFFINLLNIQADSRGTGGMVSFDANYTSAATTAGTVNTSGDIDTGYTLEIAIPWAIWGITPPVDGTIFGFDFGMNDRDTAGVRTQVFWNSKGVNVNSPSSWGKMIFEDSVNLWPGPLAGVLAVSAIWEITVPPTTVDITLAWDASVGADGYRMFVREAGKEYNYNVPDWEGSTTTCVLLGLPINIDQYFVVRAYNSKGESGDSNEVMYIGGGS